MSYLVLRSRGYRFYIPSRFAEGHSLSAGEAQAMNALLLENIRNNTKRLLDEALAPIPHTERLSLEQQLALQKLIFQYSESYQFVFRPELGAKPDPISLEARAIAEEQSKSQGQELSEQELWTLSGEPEILFEAERRVKIRQDDAAKILQELL